MSSTLKFYLAGFETNGDAGKSFQSPSQEPTLTVPSAEQPDLDAVTLQCTESYYPEYETMHGTRQTGNKEHCDLFHSLWFISHK